MVLSLLRLVLRQSPLASLNCEAESTQIGMATLLYQYTFTPYETFMGSYPHGFDKVTDVIKPGSVRVETFVLWQSAGRSSYTNDRV